MERYYPHGHPKLWSPANRGLQSEETHEAALARQAGVDAAEREKAEAEAHIRALMAMEAQTPRRSTRILARTLDRASPSPAGSRYSLRKRQNAKQVPETPTKKPKRSKAGKPKATPKKAKDVKTPKTLSTPKTPQSMKTMSTFTPPPHGRLALVVKPGREAVIETVEEVENIMHPRVIHFSIGQTRERVSIPLRSLRFECGFFRSLDITLNNIYTPMEFPDIEQKPFDLFKSWISFNTFEFGKKIEECSYDFLDLIKVYEIAEKFHSVVLKNVVIDNLVRMFYQYNAWVQYTLADEVYMRTVPGSPLRRLWIEFRIRGHGVEQGLPQLNSVFLTDVVERQREMIQDTMRGMGIRSLIAEDFYDVEADTGRIKGRVAFF